eukprot:1142574-Pelagomonas_calceolata.AAC.6
MVVAVLVVVVDAGATPTHGVVVDGQPPCLPASPAQWTVHAHARPRSSAPAPTAAASSCAPAPCAAVPSGACAARAPAATAPLQKGHQR